MKKLLIGLLIPPVWAQGNVNPGFTIPDLQTVLSYVIKLFFVIAGLAAILYLLLGAFAWITSGGEKDAVQKAQQKIQAAVIGLILLVVVIVIIATIEQYIFKQSICLGLTCNLQFGELITPRP